MKRHPSWTQNLASPRNLRLGTLVLLLIAVNEIDDPLVNASIGETFLYWIVRPVILACGLWLADSLVSRYLSGRFSNPEWLKPVVIVTAIGLLPLAIAEALLELSLPIRPEFLDEQLWAYSPLLAFVGEWATIASIVIPIHLLLWLIIDRKTQNTAEVTERTQPAVPDFLQRSTTERASDVLALQAEEHYVRIYSREGSELIHYRFGDAVDEMPTDLGLQVHRSWWVAEHAVRSAQRGTRRWQLNLNIDLAVPVSDSYAAAVRERGWLRKKARPDST